MRYLSLLLILTLTLSACATARSISPIVFQGPGFDPMKYQVDLTDCYNMVETQASGISSGTDVAGKAVGGAVLGAVAGTILGAVVGSPGRGAALGTAIGGTAGGVGAYAGSETEKRMVYHQAVTSCLTLKGYQVLGATGKMR